MTHAELDALLRKWQRRLGLDAWRIELVIDPLRWAEQRDPDSGADAFVWRSNDYDSARVYLNPDDVAEWDARTAADMVVHELVHLALRDLEHVVDLVAPLVSRDVYGVVRSAAQHELEATVDRLARQLVSLEAELAGDPALADPAPSVSRPARRPERPAELDPR